MSKRLDWPVISKLELGQVVNFLYDLQLLGDFRNSCRGLKLTDMDGLNQKAEGHDTDEQNYLEREVAIRLGVSLNKPRAPSSGHLWLCSVLTVKTVILV